MTEKLLICPECQKKGEKSFVYIGTTTSTCMYCPTFYDEEGRMHIHDLNKTTTSKSCSNGHKWTEISKQSCWCGWSNKAGTDDIFQ